MTFICSICQKHFKSSRALQGHHRMHGKSGGKLPVAMCCCLLTKQEIDPKYLVAHQNGLKPCQKCKKPFFPYKGQRDTFCSQSCSASYNNKARGSVKIPNKTLPCKTCQEPVEVGGRASHALCESCSRAKKIKHRQKAYYRDRSIKTLRTPIDSNEVCGVFTKLIWNSCHHCKTVFLSKARFKYCSHCTNQYSESAKQGFKFTFNVYDYPELFDLSLIEQHGWFSPNDYGRNPWNIHGVSRDHKVSVNDAIKNGYDPFYIRHPLNCELMLHSDNNKKKTQSSITYEELVKIVDEYECNKTK